MHAPFASITGETLTVTLSDQAPVREESFEGMADRSLMGDLVGIEILDFMQQIPDAHIDPSIDSGRFRWSYDEESDAAYLRWGKSRGQVQISVQGTATLGADRTVTRIDVTIPGVSYID